MKSGYLSQYFTGVITKKLSAVEADPEISHQHEFNGIASMKTLFGKERQRLAAKFLYLDDENDPITDKGFLTWYDARERHPTRSEYRLFFPATAVSRGAAEGDLLFIGLRPEHSALVVIAKANSSISTQLCWLFGAEADFRFSVTVDLERDRDKLEFASRYILEQLGVEIEEQAIDYLDDMMGKFGCRFPTTREFSHYARLTLREINGFDNPDLVLIAWLDREEVLFRTLEKQLIQKRLNVGFSDVDDFIRYSLSVQNRRKSRVGQSLENHFEVLLETRNIRYDRTKVTENRSRPDFIFPSIVEYHNTLFCASQLTMLGAKSTCKDRWRQVLTEADRIEYKHLITLEAAISEHQTDEMKDRKLQLVVPRPIHRSYTSSQQSWLMDVDTFIKLLLQKQGTMTRWI